MTSVKTESQAVSASSSCRLAYFKLKARANESVSFASESVSLPCELKLFHYAPAKPSCWQWLWYVLRPSCAASGQGGQVTRVPRCTLAVVVKATHWVLFRVWQFCHLFMNFTAASLKGAKPCTQKPSAPGVAFIRPLGTEPGLLGWQLVALRPPGLAFTAAYLIEPVCSFN